MTPAVALRQLASLSHSDRMRRLVELGRTSRTDPRLGAALAGLEEGGFHDRLLSLQACFGSRDGQRVLRGLGDPSRQLRLRAARLLVVVGDDRTVLDGLPRLSRKTVKRALVRLGRAGRLPLVDAYLDELARRNDRALEVLLPYGSDRAVARHLHTAAERGGEVFYKRLACHHPRRALALVDQRLAAAHRGDHALGGLARAVLPILAKNRPDEAADLLGRLARILPLASLPVALVAARRPREMARLVLETRDHTLPQGFFNKYAHHLEREQVLALARARLINLAPAGYWAGAHPYRWLERLPPALRGEVFSIVRGKRPAGIVDTGLLTLLPAALRREQASRCLALPRLATQPTARLPYVAFLDWDEALALVEPFLRHPEAAYRAAALTALAGTVRFQRHRAADYLALVRARKHEQDPVRLAMLAALTGVPAGAWQQQHLDDLGGVVREALDARDLSEASASTASHLVLRLLPRFPDWAVRWLRTLVQERGHLSWGSLEALLTDADVRRVGPALLPVLRGWRGRERDAQLLGLAAALGRRLRAFEPLVDLIEELARTTKQQWIAQQVLALIARHARARLAGLVPRLLQDDPSWIVVPPVGEFVHHRRQDLLTPFLGQKPVRGRFHSGKTRLVLPFQDGFHRWNNEQLQTFATTLCEVIRDADPTRDTVSICDALGRLAAMPGVPADEVIARAADKRLVVRDTALSLLGRLDTGEGVPVLLEALDDDRARVAIYALRRALLDMPAAHTLGLLRRVPRDRVTVAKEVLRLAGELEGDDAFAFLQEVDAGAPHRDVRVALLRALWTHLERPQAWETIDRAVAAGDPALMYAVVRIPSDRLSQAARGRLLGLLGNLLEHPDATVRLQVVQRCVEQPPSDPERTLLPHIAQAAGSSLPQLRNTAAQAVAVLATPADADTLAEAARQVLGNRPALAALVGALRAALPGQRRRLGPGSRAVLDVLAGDPLAASLRLGLAMAALGPGQFRSLLLGLDTAGWRPDVLMQAAALLQSPGDGLRGNSLRQLEDALAGSPSPSLRRLALAALLGQAGRTGWDGPRLDRLERYRRDPDPLVAADAQFTFPHDDEAAEEENDFDE
jgi:hypothetical protein